MTTDLDGLTAFLATAELFSGLGADACRRLAADLVPHQVAAGEVVLREGEPAASLHLVRHGRLRVTVEGRTVGELGPGRTVGEFALLLGTPRTATVTALRDSDLLCLPAAAFHTATTRHPDLLRNLARSLAERTVAGNARAGVPIQGSPAVRTVALVPAGRPPGAARSSTPGEVLVRRTFRRTAEVARASAHRGGLLRRTSSRLGASDPGTGGAPVVGAFASQLVAALAAYVSVERVDRGRIERALGQGAADAAIGGTDGAAVIAWLQRLEAAADIVVYVADDQPTEWTARCLRQADRVLLVADAGASPGADAAGGSLARRELVLLHDDTAVAPRGTAAWLDRLDVAAHHHVRRSSAADHARVARYLTGRAVGVVLSGGGTRGAAHLGAVRALEDAGVPIDAIAGASMGAVMAAFVAKGWGHERRVEELLGVFTRSAVRTATLPLVAVWSGSIVRRRFHRHGFPPDVRLEDLWTPYFCVSANLSRAELVVHDRGEAWRAMRASVSLPGVLPPVFHDGDLLVDGGLLDNLPVVTMRERLGGGPVVAVDLRRDVALTVKEPFEPVLSGWSVLLARLRGRDPGIPGIAAILLRAFELGSVAQGARPGATPELHLRPELPEGYSLLELQSGRGLVDLAYDQVAAELRRVKADGHPVLSASGG